MRPEYMGKNGFMTNHHRERMGVVALANPGLISVGWRLTLQYQRWGRWWLVATGQSFHACWPKFYGFCVNSDCFTSYTNFPALNWSHDHCCWDYNCSKSLQTLIFGWKKHLNTPRKSELQHFQSKFHHFFLFFPIFSYVFPPTSSPSLAFVKRPPVTRSRWISRRMRPIRASLRRIVQWIRKATRLGAGDVTIFVRLPSGYVKIAIENGHRNSEFSQ